RVRARLELYPKGGSAQLERLAEEMFQVPAVRRRYIPEPRTVDHDQRRILAALVRIAQLGPAHSGARRLLAQDGGRQSARELGRRELRHRRSVRGVDGAQQA